jgi:hypothetical protein
MYIYLGMRRVILLMKCLNVTVLTASFFAQTATPTRTPQKKSEIYYSEVLEKLRFGKGKRRPDTEINAELINEVKSHKVYFVLDDHDRKELIEAGATDELICTIDNALTDAEKKKIDEMNRLYQIVLDNYRSFEVERFSLAIKAAEEFVERFGDEEIAKPNVDWLKARLIQWEQRRKEMLRID